MNVESHFKEWIQSTFSKQPSGGRQLITFQFWNINATRTTSRMYHREYFLEKWFEREVQRQPGSDCLRRKEKAKKEERKILSIEYTKEKKLKPLH